MGFDAGNRKLQGHGGGRGALGLMHDSLEAWGTRNEAEETNRNKNGPLDVLHHLCASDGHPRTPSGHEGDRECTGGRLGSLQVAGRIGGSLVKLKGGKNRPTELPRGLPIVPKSTSVASHVNGDKLVGFTGAWRRPRGNPDRSGMHVGCKESSGTARATCSQAGRPHTGGGHRQS